MRLIDADVADKWMRQNNAFIDAAILKAIPTIDAVPVVRCRECKHTYAVDFNPGVTYCWYTRQPTPLDGYCHKGERP